MTVYMGADELGERLSAMDGGIRPRGLSEMDERLRQLEGRGPGGSPPSAELLERRLTMLECDLLEPRIAELERDLGIADEPLDLVEGHSDAPFGPRPDVAARVAEFHSRLARLESGMEHHRLPRQPFEAASLTRRLEALEAS